MQQQKLPEAPLGKLRQHHRQAIANEEGWLALLDNLSISDQRHRRIATEGALMGTVLDDGRCDDLVIVSDGTRSDNVATPLPV